jgi:hypothetical protein
MQGTWEKREHSSVTMQNQYFSIWKRLDSSPQTNPHRRRGPTGTSKTRRAPRAASGRAPRGATHDVSEHQRLPGRRLVANKALPAAPRGATGEQTTTGPGARQRWCRNSNGSRRVATKAVSVSPRGAIGRAPERGTGDVGTAARRHKASCHQCGVSHAPGLDKSCSRSRHGVGTAAARRLKVRCHQGGVSPAPGAPQVALRGATQVVSE